MVIFKGISGGYSEGFCFIFFADIKCCPQKIGMVICKIECFGRCGVLWPFIAFFRGVALSVLKKDISYMGYTLLCAA